MEKIKENPQNKTQLNNGKQSENRFPKRTEETGPKGPHIWIMWVNRRGSLEGNFDPSSVLTDVEVVENIMIFGLEEAPYPQKFLEVCQRHSHGRGHFRRPPNFEKFLKIPCAFHFLVNSFFYTPFPCRNPILHAEQRP